MTMLFCCVIDVRKVGLVHGEATHIYAKSQFCMTSNAQRTSDITLPLALYILQEGRS